MKNFEKRAWPAKSQVQKYLFGLKIKAFNYFDSRQSFSIFGTNPNIEKLFVYRYSNILVL